MCGAAISILPRGRQVARHGRCNEYQCLTYKTPAQLFSNRLVSCPVIIETLMQRMGRSDTLHTCSQFFLLTDTAASASAILLQPLVRLFPQTSWLQVADGTGSDPRHNSKLHFH